MSLPPHRQQHSILKELAGREREADARDFAGTARLMNAVHYARDDRVMSLGNTP